MFSERHDRPVGTLRVDGCGVQLQRTHILVHEVATWPWRAAVLAFRCACRPTGPLKARTSIPGSPSLRPCSQNQPCNCHRCATGCCSSPLLELRCDIEDASQLRSFNCVCFPWQVEYVRSYIARVSLLHRLVRASHLRTTDALLNALSASNNDFARVRGSLL